MVFWLFGVLVFWFKVKTQLQGPVGPGTALLQQDGSLVIWCFRSLVVDQNQDQNHRIGRGRGSVSVGSVVVNQLCRTTEARRSLMESLVRGDHGPVAFGGNGQVECVERSAGSSLLLQPCSCCHAAPSGLCVRTRSVADRCEGAFLQVPHWLIAHLFVRNRASWMPVHQGRQTENRPICCRRLRPAHQRFGPRLSGESRLCLK